MAANERIRDMAACYGNLEQIRLLANSIATLNRRARRQSELASEVEICTIDDIDRYALAIINAVEEVQDIREV